MPGPALVPPAPPAPGQGPAFVAPPPAASYIPAGPAPNMQPYVADPNNVGPPTWKRVYPVEAPDGEILKNEIVDSDRLLEVLLALQSQKIPCV